MQSSARTIPPARSERPTSLTVVLPSAILSTHGALWRLRSIRFYADPQVRRYRVYGVLEPQQGDPLEAPGAALELVGEGPDLLAATLALGLQLFSSPHLVANPLDDVDQVDELEAAR